MSLFSKQNQGGNSVPDGYKVVKNDKYDGKREFSGRTYKTENGPYASVTSIIHPDGIDFPEHMLKQYQARGTIVHLQTEHYDKHGEWVEPEKLDHDVRQYLQDIEDGNHDLHWDDCDYLGFLDQFGKHIEYKYIEASLVNHEHTYAGTADRLGYWKGNKAVFDIKTSSNYTTHRKEHYFMQMAAYAECCDDTRHMVIIPLDPTLERGYRDPIVSWAQKGYFKKFKKKRDHLYNNYEVC